MFGALEFAQKAVESGLFCVCAKMDIYSSHVNNIQIEKYLLLMTANGFNGA